MDYLHKLKNGLRSFNPAQLLLDDSDDDRTQTAVTSHSSEDDALSQKRECCGNIRASSTSKSLDTDTEEFPFSHLFNDSDSDPSRFLSIKNDPSDYITSESHNKNVKKGMAARSVSSSAISDVTQPPPHVIKQCEKLLQAWGKIKGSRHMLKYYALIKHGIPKNAEATLFRDNPPSIDAPVMLMQHCLMLALYVMEMLRLMMKQFHDVMIETAELEASRNKNELKAMENEALRESLMQQKKQNNIVNEQSCNATEVLRKMKVELTGSFVEELVELRAVCKNYKEKYEELIGDYESYVSSINKSEAGKAVDAQEAEVADIDARSDLISQLKFWQEGHSSLSIRLDSLIREKREYEESFATLQLAQKQTEVSKDEQARLEQMATSMTQMESEVQSLRRTNENLELELSKKMKALDNFSLVVEEVQKEHDNILKQEKLNQTLAENQNKQLYIEIEKLQIEKMRLEDACKASDEMNAKYEKALSDQKLLEEDNTSLCCEIRALNNKIKEIEKKSEDLIDRKTLLNMISSYMKQKGNRKRREDIFLLICEVLNISEEDRVDLGLPLAPPANRKPLSELFVEFLEKESS